MRTVLRRLGYILILAWFVPAIPATAADVLPADPPGVWHKVTQDDATTSVKCGREPKSAMCVIQLFLECALRSDNDLCRIAYGLPNDPDRFTVAPVPNEYTLYRLIRDWHLTRENMPEWALDATVPPRPGDFAIAVTMVQAFEPRPDRIKLPPGHPETSVFIVRRQATRGWRLLTGGPTTQFDCSDPRTLGCSYFK